MNPSYEPSPRPPKNQAPWFTGLNCGELRTRAEIAAVGGVILRTIHSPSQTNITFNVGIETARRLP